MIPCTKHNRMADSCLAAKAFCVPYCGLWLRWTSSGRSRATSVLCPLPDNAPAGSPIETGFCEDQQSALALQSWNSSCFQLVLGPNLTSHQWSSREHAESGRQWKSKGPQRLQQSRAWQAQTSCVAEHDIHHPFHQTRQWRLHTSGNRHSESGSVAHLNKQMQHTANTHEGRAWNHVALHVAQYIVSWSSARQGAKRARLENAFQRHHFDITETLVCNPSIFQLQAPSKIKMAEKDYCKGYWRYVSAIECLPNLPKIMPYILWIGTWISLSKNRWWESWHGEKKSKKNWWAESLVVGTLATWRQAFRPQRVQQMQIKHFAH